VCQTTGRLNLTGKQAETIETGQVVAAVQGKGKKRKEKQTSRNGRERAGVTDKDGGLDRKA
jgi:hypothetical protein